MCPVLLISNILLHQSTASACRVRVKNALVDGSDDVASADQHRRRVLKTVMGVQLPFPLLYSLPFPSFVSSSFPSLHSSPLPTERLRGVYTTRCYTNLRLPSPYFLLDHCDAKRHLVHF